MNNEIVNKVIACEASPEQAADVVCWFKHPQGSLELVERIDRDLKKEWDKYYGETAKIHTRRNWLKRVACALLIVVGSLGCGYSAYRHYVQPMPNSQQVAYAQRGERTQVVLQDGTRIYLNSQSQITFPSHFSLRERRIRLDGEAYFEVSKNPHRPFVVEMNNAAVTVLGTRFNAKSYANRPISVMLEEGSVMFSAPNIKDITLVPGEMVSYDAQLAQAHVTKAPAQMASAWHNHRIDIDKMPLEDVIDMLERNYDVTFQVHSPRCYDHAFTISMSDENLDEVLKRMDRVSPLRFHYNNKNKTVEVY